MYEQRRQEENEMHLRQEEETEMVRRGLQVEEEKQEVDIADLKRIRIPLKRPYWTSLIIDKFD